MLSTYMFSTCMFFSIRVLQFCNKFKKPSKLERLLVQNENELAYCESYSRSLLLNAPKPTQDRVSC